MISNAFVQAIKFNFVFLGLSHDPCLSLGAESRVLGKIAQGKDGRDQISSWRETELSALSSRIDGSLQYD